MDKFRFADFCILYTISFGYEILFIKGGGRCACGLLNVRYQADGLYHKNAVLPCLRLCQYRRIIRHLSERTR